MTSAYPESIVKVLLLFSLLCLIPLLPAEAFELSIVGGLNYAAPTQKVSGVGQNWTGDAAPAYGALLGTELFSTRFELESGILLMTSTYEEPGASTRNLGFTQVPFLLRFHIDEWISVGAGGYLAYTRGSRDPALTAGDQGLVLSLKAKLYLTATLQLVLDARYQHGLANMALVSSDLYNTRSIQMLAGVCIPFSFNTQEKPKAQPAIRASPSKLE